MSWVSGKAKIAKHLDVSVPTIDFLVSQGLPEYKIGERTHHYRTDEADEFMKRYLIEREDSRSAEVKALTNKFILGMGK